MASGPETVILDWTKRIGGFADDIKALGIHVGMKTGTEARCVTCGERWPCSHEKHPDGTGVARKKP